MAKHERKRSRDNAKRNSGDRKAFSNEPTPAALYGKRWEDLIDAATSATEEEGSRDLTPVSFEQGDPFYMHTTHVRLTHIDTRLAIPISTSCFTNFGTTKCIRTRLTIPIVPSFTSKSRPHAPTRRRKPRPTAVHLGRFVTIIRSFTSTSQLHRFWLTIQHHASRCHGFEQHITNVRPSPACSNLLRRVSASQCAERKLCVYELHMWALRNLRGGLGREPAERPHEWMSSMQHELRQFQAIPA